MIESEILCLAKLDKNKLTQIPGDLPEYFDYHGVKLHKDPILFKLAEEISRQYFDNHDITVLNARIHNMPAGVKLNRHTDKVPPDSEKFHVLHWPIKTNSKAYLAFDNIQVHLKQDYLYEINYGYPHWGANEGLEDRIHLFMEIYAHEKV